MIDTLSHVSAERTVLGCVLSSTDPTCIDRVTNLLRPEHFSVSAHRMIYSAVCQLANAGHLPDDLLLTNKLIELGQLELVGGVGYVTRLSDNVMNDLARVTNVENYCHLILDKFQRRQARAAGECLVDALGDISVPTADALHRIQVALLQIQANSDRAMSAVPTKELMTAVCRELEGQATNAGSADMSFGLASLDSATGGLRAGELIAIGALTGRGKTSLAAQIVLANGGKGIPTFIFSLEMTPIEIGKRFLAAKRAVHAFQLRNPQAIRKDGWAAVAETAAAIAGYPIFVDGRPSLRIEELLATARLYIRRHSVRLVVVDYIRLVSGPGRDLRERVGYVADSLRSLAKTENVAVVMLSQLKRPETGINAKPSMLDLKESGDLENHCHIVILPWLPIDDKGAIVTELSALVIGKNRNGSVGELPVYFDERTLQFCDRVKRLES